LILPTQYITDLTSGFKRFNRLCDILLLLPLCGIAGTGTLETLELEGHGETVYEVGKYTLRGTAGELLDQGKYLVVWKREKGRWRLHRDIWNSSRPATQP